MTTPRLFLVTAARIKPYQMRFLISSLVLTLCISCTSYPKKNNFKPIKNTAVSILNPYFSDAAMDYIYKANINAFDNKFGGIFIVKKLGIDHHRIVFTTELGNKIFDFSFDKNEFKVNHILKELDKKLLVNILRNDFKVLISERPIIEQSYTSEKNTINQTDILGKNHFYYSRQQELNKIIKVKSGKPNVQFLFSEINDDLAGTIEIIHNNFKLEIDLKAI